jgi:hypothetical protein
MVCAVVLVRKSLLSKPVSLEIPIVEIVCVGGATKVKLLDNVAELKLLSVWPVTFTSTTPADPAGVTKIISVSVEDTMEPPVDPKST